MICRVCGCSEFDACRGSCSWVDDPLDLGPLCSACLPAVELAQLRALLDAVGKFRITVQAPPSSLARGVAVDASELVALPDVEERWVLLDDPDGWWLHPHSGDRGPLIDVLLAIAGCYVRREAHAEVSGA